MSCSIFPPFTPFGEGQSKSMHHFYQPVLKILNANSISSVYPYFLPFTSFFELAYQRVLQLQLCWLLSCTALASCSKNRYVKFHHDLEKNKFKMKIKREIHKLSEDLVQFSKASYF